MSNDEKALVWLDSFDFMTYKKKEKLLEIIPRPSNLLSYQFLRDSASQIKTIITDEEYNLLIHSLGEDFLDKLFENLTKLGISVTTKISNDYPKSLSNISTPPFVIYYKGDKSLMDKDCFAVVGTRHLTSYGKMATEKFTKGLVEAGFVIVSGLASGIDTIAHRTTLDMGGKTIAVLANGLDQIYPPTNTALAREIVEKGGLIISETRPYRKAESFLFPIRNRIIAGLSRGVLITEAQEKSGAMHTKNYALEYGKDVFAVPGSIFSITSNGPNRLISNSHAKAVVDISDILDEYDISPIKTEIKALNMTIEEQIIINLLSSGEKTFQELADSSKLETNKLNITLTMLTIRGIVKKMAGNVYFLNN